MGFMTVSKFTALGQVNTEYSKDFGDGNFSDPKVEATIGTPRNFQNGRGARAINLIFDEGYNISPGATVTIDLNGAANQTRFGDDLAFSIVRSIVIDNLSDNDNGATLSLSGNFFTTYGEPPDVGPEGNYTQHRRDAAGYPVTGGASDTITITNNSASQIATVRVCIGGEETDVSSSSSSSSSTESSSSSSSSTNSSSSSSSSSSTSSATLSSSSSSTLALRSSSSSSSTAVVNSSSSSSDSSL